MPRKRHKPEEMVAKEVLVARNSHSRPRREWMAARP